jgi:hypothetical protein
MPNIGDGEREHAFLLTDRPKLLADPEARQARLSQLREPHVAPLTAFVDALRQEVGMDTHIPYFDPWDGGVGAQVLLLLEAPGPRAVKSGFVSRNNPDETAKNFFEINLAAGLDRKRTAVWNIVPWYIGTGTKIRGATASDIKAGIPLLLRLLGHLPKVRTAVLIGRKAERARSAIASAHPGLRLLACPHPGPLYVNHHVSHRENVRVALAAAV